MIQRIQSIYLALASMVLATVYLLDEMWVGKTAMEISWFAPLTLGLFSLSAVGALFSVFLYKSRERQRKVLFGLKVSSLGGLIVVFVAQFLSESIPFAQSVASFGSLAILLSPVVAFFLFVMAGRSIDKDIKLIRSMDRLR
jgi:phosphoglycerol transferase MdoB-like AlkP superfamily enzyme